MKCPEFPQQAKPSEASCVRADDVEMIDMLKSVDYCMPTSRHVTRRTDWLDHYSHIQLLTSYTAMTSNKQ